MLTSCSIACGAAIVSNNSAESAITRHSALLLAAIDSRGSPGNPGEGGWGL
uniref:Uncharacterized protein n=1 Tax=Ciona savignyi TaxID=51511 RepID=H2Y9M8_CIOSA